jgi:hypothetical protein
MIHVGYNTYILTIFLGLINVVLYFISTILLWKLLKNENDFVMNNNIIFKENDLEK